MSSLIKKDPKHICPQVSCGKNTSLTWMLKSHTHLTQMILGSKTLTSLMNYTLDYRAEWQPELCDNVQVAAAAQRSSTSAPRAPKVSAGDQSCRPDTVRMDTRVLIQVFNIQLLHSMTQLQPDIQSRYMSKNFCARRSSMWRVIKKREVENSNTNAEGIWRGVLPITLRYCTT